VQTAKHDERRHHSDEAIGERQLVARGLEPEVVHKPDAECLPERKVPEEVADVGAG
jgi:hypothetical protein